MPLYVYNWLIEAPVASTESILDPKIGIWKWKIQNVKEQYTESTTIASHERRKL